VLARFFFGRKDGDGQILPYWIGYGDNHGEVDNVRRIPGLAGAAAVLVTGDLTIRGGLEQGRRIIEAVREVNPRVLAQIGNMDSWDMAAWLEEQGVSLHGRAHDLGRGVGGLGVGCSTPTPFGTPCEIPDAELGRFLDAAYAKPGLRPPHRHSHDRRRARPRTFCPTVGTWEPRGAGLRGAGAARGLRPSTPPGAQLGRLGRPRSSIPAPGRGGYALTGSGTGIPRRNQGHRA
jgi:hypothetical protein